LDAEQRDDGLKCIKDEKRLALVEEELVEQSKELAEQSKELAEKSKELAEQSKKILYNHIFMMIILILLKITLVCV
jgi:hypothetical protein